jgi:phosphatidate phosphatase PAH1
MSHDIRFCKVSLQSEDETGEGNVLTNSIANSRVRVIVTRIFKIPEEGIG